MAYDKVTKLDMIAKRKPRTKTHRGLVSEYSGAYHRGGSRSVAEFKCPLTHAQLSVTVSKRGKMFRREATVSAGITTSWPHNQKVSHGG